MKARFRPMSRRGRAISGWPPWPSGRAGLGGFVSIASSPARAQQSRSRSPRIRHRHGDRRSMSGPHRRRAPIRVLVVDDHGVVRKGLRTYLATTEDIEVMGEATDGADALSQLQDYERGGELPDVVLMDLIMEPMGGIEATRTSARVIPTSRWSHSRPSSRRRRSHAALDAGASGFLLKDAEADEVAAAVRAAHRGEVHLDPAVVGRLVRSLRAPRRLRPGSDLTEPRTGSAPPGRRRQGQQGHRRHPVHQRTDRSHPCEQHPVQAGTHLTNPGRPVGGARRAGPSDLT